MNLKRLKDDGQLAWNAAGKLIELFVIFILTLLITALMGLVTLLNLGRSWVEGGHKLPAWLKPGTKHSQHEVGCVNYGTPNPDFDCPCTALRHPGVSSGS